MNERFCVINLFDETFFHSPSMVTAKDLAVKAVSLTKKAFVIISTCQKTSTKNFAYPFSHGINEASNKQTTEKETETWKKQH